MRGAGHQPDPQRPRAPDGEGQIERVFETIQQQFLAEVTGDDAHPARHPVKDLEELNGLLGAWLRTVYHARVHSETGQAPQARLAAAGPPSLPDPALLKEAFSWSVIRQVRKTGTVAVEGNVYSVDPFLAGRKVECVFDPFDMTELTVYWQGRKVGRAVPQVIGRHAHPKAPPDEDPAPAALTGIDYLQLVTDADAAALGEQLNLAALDDSDDPAARGGGGRGGTTVNAEALPAGQLACLLYDAAEGICADIAAVMLIDRHGHFLHEPAFRRIIAAGSSITTGQPLAVIRWNAAIHALEAGQLPCCRLRAGRPADRRQPGRPRHRRQPPGEPRQPRSAQHRPGHRRHHRRQRLTPDPRAAAPPGHGAPAPGKEHR